MVHPWFLSLYLPRIKLVVSQKCWVHIQSLYHNSDSFANFITADEFGTASNIKSRVNRLSVLGAITSTQQRLKLYNKVPTNGLVIYCGTIVTAEGKEKKVNIDFEPFKPINTSLYLCDNKFHTEVFLLTIHISHKFSICNLLTLQKSPSMNSLSLMRSLVSSWLMVMVLFLELWVETPEPCYTSMSYFYINTNIYYPQKGASKKKKKKDINI